MHTENYNIHNIISFQIRNDDLKGFLKNFNPEYEYFMTSEAINPDFRITVTKQLPAIKDSQHTKHIFTKEYTTWSVCVVEEHSGFVDLYIKPRLSGVRKLVSYTAIKNIYVRSLLYYCLIKKGGTLIHSSGVQIDGKSCLFVGRPGVFKTSILMDLIRKHNASFLGEENVLFVNGVLYPFPLNIRSLDYKIRHFNDENPRGKLQKLMLGLSLLGSSKTPAVSGFPISKKEKPYAVAFLKKANNVSIASCLLEDIIDDLVDNEIQELSIPPTHSLAGIKDNHFSSLITSMEANALKRFKSNLYEIFRRGLKESDCYQITTPSKYDLTITDKILKQINGRN